MGDAERPDNADETVDLWDTMPDAAAIKPPVVILKEQASLLTRKTAGRLRGLVETKASSSDIYHTFYIVAPALQNYRYGVFEVYHPILLYPVTVWNAPNRPAGGLKLKNEAEFVGWLKSVLSSSEVRQTISALLAQVQS